MYIFVRTRAQRAQNPSPRARAISQATLRGCTRSKWRTRATGTPQRSRATEALKAYAHSLSTCEANIEDAAAHLVELDSHTAVSRKFNEHAADPPIQVRTGHQPADRHTAADRGPIAAPR